MIVRVAFRYRLMGPGLSLEDAVVREHVSTYPAAYPVDELTKVPHGVKVRVGEVAFEVPWASIAYTQSIEEAKPPKGARS